MTIDVASMSIDVFAMTIDVASMSGDDFWARKGLKLMSRGLGPFLTSDVQLHASGGRVFELRDAPKMSCMHTSKHRLTPKNVMCADRDID